MLLAKLKLVSAPDTHGKDVASAICKAGPPGNLAYFLGFRREIGTATITVFVMATIAAIFFLLVDMVLSRVVQFVLGLGS